MEHYCLCLGWSPRKDNEQTFQWWSCLSLFELILCLILSNTCYLQESTMFIAGWKCLNFQSQPAYHKPPTPSGVVSRTEIWYIFLPQVKIGTNDEWNPQLPGFLLALISSSVFDSNIVQCTTELDQKTVNQPYFCASVYCDRDQRNQPHYALLGWPPEKSDSLQKKSGPRITFYYSARYQVIGYSYSTKYTFFVVLIGEIGQETRC